MNKKYQKAIRERLAEVRENVRVHQTEVDRQVKRYARQYEQKGERLRPEALMQEDLTDRAVLKGAVEFSANQAALAIDLAFDDIEGAVNEWVTEPPSSAFTAVMGTVDRFNLQLSRSEIETLSPLASGSYIGQRVLEAFAAASGMSTNFQSVSRLKQILAAARSDALLAVHAYCTQDPNRFGWITEKTYPIFRRVYAMDYLQKEVTSLTDLQESLDSVMDPAVSLLPSEREKIGRFFDGYKGESRITRMKELIEADPQGADRFALYDADVYRAAREQIAEEAYAKDQAALEAVKKASAAAVEAHKAATQARLDT